MKSRHEQAGWQAQSNNETAKQGNRDTRGRHSLTRSSRHPITLSSRHLANLSLFLFILSRLLLTATTAHAQGPITDIKTDVGFLQHPGAQIPGDLTFRDDTGATVRLSDYFGKPTILTLNYYHCPNMCPLSFDHLTNALADLPYDLGKQYQVVTVSIDPRETPDLAAETKWIYVRTYARPGLGDGWHFLTGEESSIEQLAQAVGFRYEYNAETDEYAHPLGLIFLTADGKITRYIYGTDYASRDVRLALDEASQGKIASPIDQLLLICYHYDPANGRYSSTILDVTRIAGVTTVLGLGLFIGFLFKTDAKRNR